MSAVKSDFLRIATERGFVQGCTDAEGLARELREGSFTAYVGYDCTADSLHVGSLVSIMLLRLFQRCGHRPIVLMGGGTTKVGDPSGKDEQRQLLTEEQIARNMAGIRSVFEKFLGFGRGPTDAIMANNAEWLDRLGYVEFLREVGRHFTINRMLTFDSVRLRLEREQPLTFLEFNYMLLQAYDFVELARRYDCKLQMGGSDQWGNIVNGVELGRRLDGRALYGLTTPLITTADGGKMGKTEKGAVWLNADLLGPYDYWQFWRNTQDADVGKFLRRFTDLPLDEIERLERLEGAEINEAKKVLADQTTAMLHGADAAREASETARRTFEEGTAGEALPTLAVPEGTIGLADALVGLGLTASKKEARRLIGQGGARVDGEALTDEQAVVTVTDQVRVSAGRKKHGLLTR